MQSSDNLMQARVPLTVREDADGCIFIRCPALPLFSVVGENIEDAKRRITLTLGTFMKKNYNIEVVNVEIEEDVEDIGVGGPTAHKLPAHAIAALRSA